MAQFLILASIRSLIFQLLFGFILSKLGMVSVRRRALAAVIALIAAAGLDGATPDGWEIEYALGHPFYYYLLWNTPAVLLIFAFLVLFHREKAAPPNPFDET